MCIHVNCTCIYIPWYSIYYVECGDGFEVALCNWLYIGHLISYACNSRLVCVCVCVCCLCSAQE